MKIHVIGFVAPIIGVENSFNTFRMGTFYLKRIFPGDDVLLLNEKEKMVFGRARVEKIVAGPLEEMCEKYAETNHTEVNNTLEGASERLYLVLKRLYGPHIAAPSKKATVIFLKRIE